jgi:hypothetical protein
VAALAHHRGRGQLDPHDGDRRADAVSLRAAVAGRSDEGEFARVVEDPDFGPQTVLDIWMGIVTSFAWHAGQIALTAKLLPDTPVTTMQFDYWKAQP